MMSIKLKNLLISANNLKEVMRIAYDYFKHLTTISASSIGVIAALGLKVFNEPKYLVLLIISIASLFLCLLASIWVLSVPGNAILYLVAYQTIASLPDGSTDKQKKDIEEIQKKYDHSLDQIHNYDIFTKITFLVGIIVFLLFFGLNLKIGGAKMYWSLWSIIIGLGLTLIGIIVTFCVKPPRIETLNRKKLFSNGVEKLEHLPTPPGPSVEDVERKETLMLKFSFVGVGLLVLGTILQLVGAIGQIVQLTGKK